MSTASHALPGKPSFGGLLARIALIILLWAALVTGTLHYVGYAWPKAYQISQAEKQQADEMAENALKPPAGAASASAAPASSSAKAAPASTAASTPAATASTSATKTPPAAPANSSTPVPAPAAASPASAPAAASTAASTSTPAANISTSAAPAAKANSAAPAASAGSSASATPAPAAASAPKATGEQKLPFDLRLAGYNRTAFGNLSIFFSIVISVFCVGTIILQIFKYKHVEEEAMH